MAIGKYSRRLWKYSCKHCGKSVSKGLKCANPACLQKEIDWTICPRCNEKIKGTHHIHDNELYYASVKPDGVAVNGHPLVEAMHQKILAVEEQRENWRKRHDELLKICSRWEPVIEISRKILKMHDIYRTLDTDEERENFWNEMSVTYETLRRYL